MSCQFPKIALFALCAVAGCDAELNFSGRWQMIESCTQQDCDGFVYELHLGQYGDSLAGMVVRYLDQGDGYSFERTSECGCFLIEAGKAKNDQLRFQLHRPDLPGPPEGNEKNAACSPIPADPCQDRIFILKGEEDILSGQMLCNTDDPEPLSIRFQSVVGRTRTVCAQESEP